MSSMEKSNNAMVVDVDIHNAITEVDEYLSQECNPQKKKTSENTNIDIIENTNNDPYLLMMDHSQVL